MKLQELHEARNPKLSYEEKKTKGVVNRVIVQLKMHDSGTATRLTKKYEELDLAMKELTEKRNALNEDMKEMVEDLFNAEDCVYTRVVETASYTITLSKAEKAETKAPTEKVDYEAAFKALAALVPDLTTQVEKITKEYTEIVPAKDTPASLRIKKVDEGFRDVARKIMAECKKLLASITSWAAGYDAKLAKLKQKY